MKVGLYQYRPLFGKVRRNTDKVISVLENCQADLLVLPELAFTGYYFRDRAEVETLAEEPAASPTVDALKQLCKKKNFYIVTGFAEKDRDKYFNSALLIGPEGLIHTYRKLHLFNEEKKWFDNGDIPLQVNRVRGAKIGIMVCFDWLFPEVTRTLALNGAEIICHPSNLVLAYCQQTMLARCIENRVFAITANRFGVDKRPHGQLRFTGKSQVVAPGGKLLYRAPTQREILYVMDVDPIEAHDKFITANNDVINDRRPEFYIK